VAETRGRFHSQHRTTIITIEMGVKNEIWANLIKYAKYGQATYLLRMSSWGLSALDQERRERPEFILGFHVVYSLLLMRDYVFRLTPRAGYYSSSDS